MKNRVVEKPVRKAYEPPKLVVYGKVSDLTRGGSGRDQNGGDGRVRGGQGRGSGGSRS